MSAAKTGTPPRTAKAADEGDLFSRLESFLSSRQKILLFVFIGLNVLFTFLLFDGRLSFATDDANYVSEALNIIERGSYPQFQGPLYPLVLSFIIRAFGCKILVMKFFSCLFMIGGNALLFMALRNRVPYLMLICIMLVSAINPYLLAYGSSTFSEAFYYMLQSWGIFSFFNLIDKMDQDASFKHTWKNWLLLGLTFFLMSLARKVALFAIIPVAIYFLFKKRWSGALFALCFFALFYVPFNGIVKVKFPYVQDSQASGLMNKDYYHPEAGTEDMDGFIDRFFTNYGNYVSIHAFKMLNLRGKGVPTIYTMEKMEEIQKESPMYMESSSFYGLIFLVLFVAALYFAFKQNRYLFFIFLYTGSLMGITFIALQASWNQDRLMVLYLPFIFGSFIFALYGFMSTPQRSGMQFIVPGLAGILILMQLFSSMGQVGKNSKQFKAFRNGDPYAGYAQGTKSFLMTSAWAGHNIKDTNYIATVYPLEATVFGGRIGYKKPPRSLPGTLDSLAETLKKAKIGYFMLSEAGDPSISRGLEQLGEQLSKMNQKNIEQLQMEDDGVSRSAVFKYNYPFQVSQQMPVPEGQPAPNPNAPPK